MQINLTYMNSAVMFQMLGKISKKTCVFLNILIGNFIFMSVSDVLDLKNVPSYR